MISCPKCSSDQLVKDGFINKNQRYKCKNCNYRPTVKESEYRGNKNVKRAALELYLEGLGFRSIGRILKYSHVSIYNWIRSMGAKIKELKKTEEAKYVEIDEMHTYVSKKTTDGYGYLLIELEKSSLILLSEKEIHKRD